MYLLFIGGEFILRQVRSTDSTEVFLLGNGDEMLSFHIAGDGLHIEFPVIPYGMLKHAWVFKLVNVV